MLKKIILELINVTFWVVIIDALVNIIRGLL